MSLENSLDGLYGIRSHSVETPTGTPSPPGAASTVARPGARSKISDKPDMKAPIFGLEEEEEMTNLSLKNLKRGQDTPYASPNEGFPNRSSLGLLPQEALENCTFSNWSKLSPSYNPLLLMDDDDDDKKKSDSHEGLIDNSAETVIRKLSPKRTSLDFEEDKENVVPEKVSHANIKEVPFCTVNYGEKSMMGLHPIPEQPEIQENEESLIDFGLPSKYLMPTPSQKFEQHKPVLGLSCLLDSTIEEEKGDFSCVQEAPNPFEDPSGIKEMSDFSNVAQQQELCDNPFDDGQCLKLCGQNSSKEFQEIQLEFEEKGGEEKDNAEFIDAEEKANEEEYKFMIMEEEQVVKNDSSSATTTRTSSSSNTSSSLANVSMSGYFLQGTSRTGYSFELESNSGQERPNFGFEDIHSPPRRPVAVVQPAEVEVNKSLVQQENGDGLHVNDGKENENLIAIENPTDKIVKNTEEEIVVLSNDGKENEHLISIENPTDQMVKNTEEEIVVVLEEKTTERTLLEKENSSCLVPRQSSEMVTRHLSSQSSLEMDIGHVLDVISREIETEKSDMVTQQLFADGNTGTKEQSVVLEQTLSILQESKALEAEDTNYKHVARALVKSSPGHDAKYYASLVLKMLGNNIDAMDDTLTDLTQYLPSFIVDSPAEDNSTFEEGNNTTKKSSSSKTNKSNVSWRHSSPVKTNKVTTETTYKRTALKNLSNFQTCESEQQTKQVFPIESDRTVLTWMGDMSECEQCVVLHNTRPTLPTSMVLLIRNDEHDEFTFKESKAASLEVSVGPRATKKIFVTYKPKLKRDLSTAHLVIKPHGLSRSTGATLKATIRLQALGCDTKHCLIIKSNGHTLQQHTRNLDLTNGHSLVVKNKGSFKVFVKALFKDSPLHALEIHPNNFVMEPKQETRLQVTFAGRTTTTAVQLVLFHGPEIARQVYKRLEKEEDNASSLLLMGQSFKDEFDNEVEEMNKMFIEKDLKYFYDYLHKDCFNVLLKEQQFYRLEPEETFNNTSVVVKKRGGVGLEREIVYCPFITCTQTSSSVAKVVLKNRTEKVQKFSVSSLASPFHNYHDFVEVKPNFYLSIPVKYSPLENGRHEASMVLKNVDDGRKLTATLVGARNV